MRRAYDKIKVGQTATLDDLARNYDPTLHPDVVSGKQTADVHYKHFLSLWDTKKPEGFITWTEFEEFYRAISSATESEDVFRQLVQQEWHL